MSTKTNIMILFTTSLMATALTGCGTAAPFERGAQPGAQGAGPGTAGTTSPVLAQDYFVAQVHPNLKNDCKGCHGGGFTTFTVTDSALTDYALAKTFIVAGSPSTSRIYRKATGQGHGGGVVWDVTSPEAMNMSAWIQSEAP
jgi:hypothetical protein